MEKAREMKMMKTVKSTAIAAIVAILLPLVAASDAREAGQVHAEDQRTHHHVLLIMELKK